MDLLVSGEYSEEHRAGLGRLDIELGRNWPPHRSSRGLDHQREAYGGECGLGGDLSPAATGSVAIVGEILRTSATEPIIILQSDHGPLLSLAGAETSEQESARRRLGILNTAYLPNGGEAAFYEGMSPVNTFRAIFNHYFGTSYELLEDRHFLSSPATPYDFVAAMIEGRN